MSFKSVYTMTATLLAACTLALHAAASEHQGEPAVGTTEADDTVTYHAVLCGVSDYPGSSFDLSYCDDDARDIRDALLAAGNWESTRIATRIDSGATKSQIYAAIQQMAAAADADDVCVFALVGRQLAGLDTRLVQKVVDDVQEPMCVPLDAVESVVLLI